MRAASRHPGMRRGACSARRRSSRRRCAAPPPRRPGREGAHPPAHLAVRVPRRAATLEHLGDVLPPVLLQQLQRRRERGHWSKRSRGLDGAGAAVGGGRWAGAPPRGGRRGRPPSIDAGVLGSPSAASLPRETPRNQALGRRARPTAAMRWAAACGQDSRRPQVATHLAASGVHDLIHIDVVDAALQGGEIGWQASSGGTSGGGGSGGGTAAGTGARPRISRPTRLP